MTESLFRIQFDEMMKQYYRKAYADVRDSGAPSARIVWRGKLRELGDLVLKLYHGKLIQAASETDALRQACEHFVRPKGGRIDPRALLQNTRNARDKRVGRL